MLQVFVNDLPHSIPMPMATWGELLANLDVEAAGQGLLLTHARFDGVDEPSFRESVVTSRRLGEFTRVDVETATPAAFLRQCLQDSIRPLNHSADNAARLSAIYRQHDVSAGHEGLTALASELRGLTSLIGMLAGPLQVDLGSFLAANGTTVDDEMDEFATAIDSLVSAQESQDWLTVADVLEYDLEPAIRRWVELLTTVAVRLK